VQIAIVVFGPIKSNKAKWYK